VASTVAGLARFFPDATPVRIAVQLARTNSAADPSGKFTESTVIEFGTPREVLFSCTTPLEFADVLRLRNSDGRWISKPRSWPCNTIPAKPWWQPVSWEKCPTGS